MRKANALLEIYRFTRFCSGGRAEVPGETDPAQGSPFQFVDFGPREIREDQAAGVTGVAWAARRDELVAAGFAGQRGERPCGGRPSGS
jgi:hypothetical protein